jgi:hypothetical protein
MMSSSLVENILRNTECQCGGSHVNECNDKQHWAVDEESFFESTHIKQNG